MDLDILLSDRHYILERLKRDSLRRNASELRGLTVDLGCGTGQYRRFLSSASSYFGIDRSMSSAVAVVADVSAVPLADESVNSVLMTEVIEHVPEPLQALREAHRVLVPGGIAYVSAPMTWALHHEPHDYYRFTPYGLRYLAEQAGFDTLRVERVGGVIAMLLVRWIDAIATLGIERPMRRLGFTRGLDRGPALVFAPFSLAAYGLSRALDGWWETDVIVCAAVLRKPHKHSDD